MKLKLCRRMRNYLNGHGMRPNCKRCGRYECIRYGKSDIRGLKGQRGRHFIPTTKQFIKPLKVKYNIATSQKILTYAWAEVYNNRVIRLLEVGSLNYLKVVRVVDPAPGFTNILVRIEQVD